MEEYILSAGKVVEPVVIADSFENDSLITLQLSKAEHKQMADGLPVENADSFGINAAQLSYEGEVIVALIYVFLSKNMDEVFYKAESLGELFTYSKINRKDNFGIIETLRFINRRNAKLTKKYNTYYGLPYYSWIEVPYYLSPTVFRKTHGASFIQAVSLSINGTEVYSEYQDKYVPNDTAIITAKIWR